MEEQIYSKMVLLEKVIPYFLIEITSSSSPDNSNDEACWWYDFEIGNKFFAIKKPGYDKVFKIHGGLEHNCEVFSEHCKILRKSTIIKP